MLWTAVDPVTRVGSPIDRGSRAGRAPKTPASYTSWRSGLTVRWARLQAMFGGPTPTKHTRSPASCRALATIIISAGVHASSDSGIAPVVHLARPGLSGPQRLPPLLAQ